jgi:hemerythrin superfamily protein
MPRSMNALDLLRRDHRVVQSLLKKFDRSDDEDEQRSLCDQIVSELQSHADIEERVFYPWLREATAREDLFEEASIEHQTAKDLLARLPDEQPGTPRFKAMVKVLGEYVMHHVEEEEGTIFPQVEKTGVDLQALGLALQQAREGGDPMAMDGETTEATEATEADGGGQGDTRSAGRTARSARQQAKDDEAWMKEHAGELSKSTARAKWIHAPGEGPDHDGQTLATRSPEVIRAWAEARKATPATSPGGDVERPRVLRFDFPGYDKNLQEVSWDAWLGTFQERDLVFVFQETMKAGNQSNFFLLDNPEREEG